MKGVGPSVGPATSPAQKAQGVEAKQMANQVQMGKVLEKMGKGEISKGEGQKQIAALLQEQVKLQASLAPGAAAGANPSSSGEGKGHGTRDTFEPSARVKPLYELNGAGFVPATVADLQSKGGGSKPGVIR